VSLWEQVSFGALSRQYQLWQKLIYQA
jgi:hypothetical protein